MSMINNKLL